VAEALQRPDIEVVERMDNPVDPRIVGDLSRRFEFQGLRAGRMKVEEFDDWGHPPHPAAVLDGNRPVQADPRVHGSN
jgi:hypothetical protein